MRNWSRIRRKSQLFRVLALIPLITWHFSTADRFHAKAKLRYGGFMSANPPFRTDDIANCVRTFVAAAVLGGPTDVVQFANNYFAYRDSEVAERLVARVVSTVEEMRDREAAAALGMCELDWAAYEAIFLRHDPV